MLQIVEYCRTEGIIPNLPANLYTPSHYSSLLLSLFSSTLDFSFSHSSLSILSILSIS